MFIILLTFSDKKAQAGQFMDGHNQWLQRGFNDGVFLMAGSLQPNRGGGILAYNTSAQMLETRVNEDPFVQHNVVKAEILEITPAKVDERLRNIIN